MASVDESAPIPSSGHFYGDEAGQGNNVGLPDYRVLGNSHCSPPMPRLTLTDCHHALLAIIKKARLIGFEIVHRRRSFGLARPAADHITLHGEPRELDVALSTIYGSMDYYLALNDLFFQYESTAQAHTDSVFQRLLRANARFKAGNDDLKRMLLRIEKKVGQSVVEPMKKALIYNDGPDYKALLSSVADCEKGIQRATKSRYEATKAATVEVSQSAPWTEVVNLAERVDQLRSKAMSCGWRSWADQYYKSLDAEKMFSRADGPSSVVTYLESWLANPDNTSNRPPMVAPQTNFMLDPAQMPAYTQQQTRSFQMTPQPNFQRYAPYRQSFGATQEPTYGATPIIYTPIGNIRPRPAYYQDPDIGRRTSTTSDNTMWSDTPSLSSSVSSHPPSGLSTPTQTPDQTQPHRSSKWGRWLPSRISGHSSTRGP